MTTTIMPSEHSLGSIFRSEKREYAFYVARPHHHFILFILLRNHTFKKTRGWELFTVADYHGLIGSQDSSKRVYGLHLTCFIENNHIESDASGRQIHGNGHRAHHKYRLDCLDGLAGFFHEPSYRKMSSPFLHLVPQKAHLSKGTIPWELLPVFNSQTDSIDPKSFLIQAAEGFSGSVVTGAIETSQCGALLHSPNDKLVVPVEAKSIREATRSMRPFFRDG